MSGRRRDDDDSRQRSQRLFVQQQQTGDAGILLYTLFGMLTPFTHASAIRHWLVGALGSPPYLDGLPPVKSPV